MRLQAAVLPLVAALAVSLAAQSPAAAPAPGSALAQVVGQALLHSQANQNLEELTDTIGERLTGTPNAQRAVQWALERMRAMGLTNVHKEDYTVAHGWQRGVADVELLTGTRQKLHAVSMGWTGSTAPGGADGELLAVNAYELPQLAEHPGDWKGKVLLLRAQGKPPAGYSGLDSFVAMPKFLAAAHAAGALAVIGGQGAGASAGMNITHTGVVAFNQLLDEPMINLTAEDQTLLERSLDHGRTVRLHVDIENHVSGPVTASNAVGEVRGREHPDEIVVIGGHLDSWDLATGATDNGTGAVAALAAAQAIVASGQPPRRTVRVVLFTGEEQGLLGSVAYCQQHASEMPNTVAALIMDEGQGPIVGMDTGGHDEILPALHTLAGYLTAFPAPKLTDMSMFETDTGPFTLAGAAGINLPQDSPNYAYTHHSPVDTYDHVRQDVLVRNAAEMAAMAYYIADAPQRLTRQFTPAETAAMLKKQGFEKELRAFGLWNFPEN
jgi:hypothetical protein